MKLKEYSKEDLEQMTYSEIAEIIINEKGSKMKIVDIFKKISNALELTEKEFENKIANFFEIISTDSRFIVLDKGYCDLRKKHVPDVVFDEEEEEEILEDTDIEEVIQEEDEEETDIFYDNSSDDDVIDDGEEELSDFVIVDEDEEETGI